MGIKFNIVTLFALTLGIALGLEFYRVTRDNDLPPLPKYRTGMYVLDTNGEIDDNGFRDICEIVMIRLEGSEGKWYYTYAFEKQHGLSWVSGGYVSERTLDQLDTSNQSQLKKEYEDYFNFYEKQRKEKQSLQRESSKESEDDNVAIKTTWARYPQV